MKSASPRICWIRRIAGVLVFASADSGFYAWDSIFFLVDDIHAYTRYMLGEFYAQEGQIDTLFLGVVPTATAVLTPTW